MRVGRVAAATITLVVVTACLIAAVARAFGHRQPFGSVLFTVLWATFFYIGFGYILVSELRFARGGLRAQRHCTLLRSMNWGTLGPITGTGRCMILIKPPISEPLGLFERLSVEAQPIQGLGHVRAVRAGFGSRGSDWYEVRVPTADCWVVQLNFTRRGSPGKDVNFVVEIHGRCELAWLPDKVA